MQKGIMTGIIAAVVLIVIVIGYNSLYNQSSDILPAAETAPSTESKTESAASQNIIAREGLIEARIENFQFAPSEIKIKVGSKVTWTNYDTAPHTVTSDSGGKTEVTSKLLGTGESYAHVFEAPGVFNYHCNLHPNMKGKVVVE